MELNILDVFSEYYGYISMVSWSLFQLAYEAFCNTCDPLWTYQRTGSSDARAAAPFLCQTCQGGDPSCLPGEREFGTTIWALAVASLVTVSGLFSVDRGGNGCLQDYLHHELMLLILTQLKTTGFLRTH